MKLVNSFTKLLSSTSKLKTVHLQGFWSKTCISKKNRASSRLLAKNRVSQVFWEPIKNRVSPRSVLLEAVYLEALLYIEISNMYILKYRFNYKLGTARPRDTRPQGVRTLEIHGF